MGNRGERTRFCGSVGIELYGKCRKAERFEGEENEV
jgi:hypothetical protein